MFKHQSWEKRARRWVFKPSHTTDTLPSRLEKGFKPNKIEGRRGIKLLTPWHVPICRLASDSPAVPLLNNLWAHLRRSAAYLCTDPEQSCSPLDLRRQLFPFCPSSPPTASLNPPLQLSLAGLRPPWRRSLMRCSHCCPNYELLIRKQTAPMYEQMDCSIIILKQMTGNAFRVLGWGIVKGFVKHMGFLLFSHRYVRGYTATGQHPLTHWICTAQDCFFYGCNSIKFLNRD